MLEIESRTGKDLSTRARLHCESSRRSQIWFLGNLDFIKLNSGVGLTSSKYACLEHTALQAKELTQRLWK